MNIQPKHFTVYGADVVVATPCLVSVIIHVPWDVNFPPPTEKDYQYLVDKTKLLACYLMREGHVADLRDQNKKVTLIGLCKTKNKTTK